MGIKQEKPNMPYPTGLWRSVLRLPLQFYKLGLGELVGLMPFMIVTTKGRRTGMNRHAVLEYRRHGSKIYVVSVWGARPNWYKNILQHPAVTLQLGGKQVHACAYPVTDTQEAARAVYRFRKHSPLYARILARISSAEQINFGTLVDVSGEFTVVRFEPSSQTPQLEGVQATHWWVTVVGAVLFSVMMVRRLTNRKRS